MRKEEEVQTPYKQRLTWLRKASFVLFSSKILETHYANTVWVRRNMIMTILVAYYIVLRLPCQSPDGARGEEKQAKHFFIWKIFDNWATVVTVVIEKEKKLFCQPKSCFHWEKKYENCIHQKTLFPPNIFFHKITFFLKIFLFRKNTFSAKSFFH